ncbi:MAG: cobalamin-dependent protein [Proteobacteria bacterium]|nr:cobalamin-dependent protein [Pseudomonadota bacterium]
MSKSKEKFDAVLVGIAGSFNAMSLSVYNLKSYAFSDPEIRRQWNIHIIQSPLINVMQQNVEVPKLVEQIIAKKPQIVGFSCYMWNLNVFKEIAKELKKEIPNAWIVWGGPEMTKDYIDEGKYADFEMDIAISGEGERTFLQFTQYATYGEPALSEVPGLSFREKGSKEHFTINGPSEPFKTLLEVPSPFLTGVVDDEILFRRKMQVNIETQRGCSLRCSYCIYHKDMSKISYSTSDRVIDEVQYVINKGVKNLRFVDANFTSELEHAKNIMRGFIDRKFETKLMFELIPGFIDEEMAALFGEFRDLYPWNEVTLGVGVQTINLEVLRMMRRAIRVDKFEMTFDLIQKYNLYAKIDLIIDLVIVLSNILNHLQDAVLIVIATHKFSVPVQCFVAITHGNTMTHCLEHGQVIELVANGTDIFYAEVKQ